MATAPAAVFDAPHPHRRVWLAAALPWRAYHLGAVISPMVADVSPFFNYLYFSLYFRSNLI
jgi:hypothetical protein